jgi:hypothetical protein
MMDYISTISNETEMENDLLQFLQSQRELAAQLWEELQYKLLYEMCEVLIQKVPHKFAKVKDVLKLRYYRALSLSAMMDLDASWKEFDELYKIQEQVLGVHHIDTIRTLIQMIKMCQLK